MYSTKVSIDHTTTLKTLEDHVPSSVYGTMSSSKAKGFAVVTKQYGSTSLKHYNVVQRFFIAIAHFFGLCSHISFKYDKIISHLTAFSLKMARIDPYNSVELVKNALENALRELQPKKAEPYSPLEHFGAPFRPLPSYSGPSLLLEQMNACPSYKPWSRH